MPKTPSGRVLGVVALVAVCAVEACSDGTTLPSAMAGSGGAAASSGTSHGFGGNAGSGGSTGGNVPGGSAGQPSQGGTQPAGDGGVGGAGGAPRGGAGHAGDAGAGDAGAGDAGAGDAGAGNAGAGGADGEACNEQGAPPDWTLDATTNVDDPRWQQAGGAEFPDFTAGGVVAARSRLLDDQGTLFLQLRISKDVTPGNVASGTYRDSVYVAFADSTLATISVVRIAIDNTGATHAARWTKSNGTWASGPAGAGAPTWLTGFTALINPATSGTETVSWAVNLKLVTTATPGAKLWYGVSISPSGVAQTQMYFWPQRGSFVEPAPPDTGASAASWGAQFDAIGAANWGDYSASIALRCPPQ